MKWLLLLIGFRSTWRLCGACILSCTCFMLAAAYVRQAHSRAVRAVPAVHVRQGDIVCCVCSSGIVYLSGAQMGRAYSRALHLVPAMCAVLKRVAARCTGEAGLKPQTASEAIRSAAAPQRQPTQRPDVGRSAARPLCSLPRGTDLLRGCLRYRLLVMTIVIMTTMVCGLCYADIK